MKLVSWEGVGRDELGVVSGSALDFGNCRTAAHRASLLNQIEDQQIAHLVARSADEIGGGRRGTTIADPFHAPSPVWTIPAGVVIEHLQPKARPGSAAIASLWAKIGDLLAIILAVDERPDTSASSPPRTAGSFKCLVFLQQRVVNGVALFPPTMLPDPTRAIGAAYRPRSWRTESGDQLDSIALARVPCEWAIEGPNRAVDPLGQR